MDFGFSSNAYTSYSLIEAIQRIKACGYTSIEILADIPHAFPSALSAKEIILISNALVETGLAVNNINANTCLGFNPAVLSLGETVFEPSLCSRIADVREKRIIYTEKCIDLAVDLGADCISITSGRCLPGNPPALAYAALMNSVETILNYAVKKNVHVGIEYEPGLLLEKADEVMHFLAKFSSPYLGVNLDIGHAKVAGESLTDVIKLFSDKILHIHLEDICGQKHYHLIPGDGDIDFSAVFKALVSIGYKRYITLELYTYVDQPDMAARRALSYLKQIRIGDD